MKITIVGSMQFAEKMAETKKELEEMGHEIFLPKGIEKMLGKNDQDIEEIKLHQKNNEDAITQHWNLIKQSDAILVLNYNKNDIANYIGANSLMEMGFAYVLELKIFLLNPIPEMPYCKTEIEAMKPHIIKGKLSNIDQL